MSPERWSIAELAYQLWVKRGCPEGSEELDWLEAERQLAVAEARSTPASAPSPDGKVGSLPDSEPANGDEAWQRGTDAAASSIPERRQRGGARGRSGASR
jgi:hypothetical protein